MEMTTIAGTEIQASRIGLGTWAIGGFMWGGNADDEGIATIRAAIDRGITLIDTAPVYGFGRAEELVGRAVAEAGARDRVVLSTKAGLSWDEAENVYRDSRSARLRRELEDSLRRLQTDVIDVYHVHWPDPLVPFDETAALLARFQEEGKVRAIGVSNYDPEQMGRFRKGGPLQVCQPPYNLFERQIERDVLPYCREQGLTTLTYGALCRGLLSGKMSRERRFDGDDLRQVDPKFQGVRFQQYLAAVDRLEAYARDRFDRGVIHLALRWLLDRPGVGVALWGARRPDQLDPIDGVTDFALTEDDYGAIDGLLTATIQDPVGPEFMAPPPRQDV
jgi:aryl-alcohol dehydrogenase-like predicted oxidoreductase